MTSSQSVDLHAPIPLSARLLLGRANSLALSSSLHDQALAKDLFMQVLAIASDNLDAWVNLGILLFETGYTLAAITAFSAAAHHHPEDARVRAYLGNALLYKNDLEAARIHFDIALKFDPGSFHAHQGLASICRRLGNDQESAMHRHLGFKDHAVSILPAYAQTTPLRLLVLASAHEGNIPWRLLIDRSAFHSTMIAVEYFEEHLPPHDLVFNAIGDADLCREALEKSVSLLNASTAPVINRPEAVLLSGRISNSTRLADLPGVLSPAMHLAARRDYANAAFMHSFPFLLRSPGYHGGSHFFRIDDQDALLTALEELPGEELLHIEYLDYRSPDGLFRKYRAMSINGSLYPVHLAISRNWNVHYFSSDMERNASYRDEEASFLNGFERHLGAKIISALENIQLALGLDYCGIDFGIDVYGRVILFEANPTMLINPPAHEEKWDYRRDAISKALSATRNMLFERAALSRR